MRLKRMPNLDKIIHIDNDIVHLSTCYFDLLDFTGFNISNIIGDGSDINKCYEYKLDIATGGGTLIVKVVLTISEAQELVQILKKLLQTRHAALGLSLEELPEITN